MDNTPDQPTGRFPTDSKKPMKVTAVAAGGKYRSSYFFLKPDAASENNRL